MRFARNLKGIKILAEKSKNVTIPYVLAVGQVVNCPDSSTREVKVIKMEKDNYLKMYFNKSYKILSADEKKESQIGDIVLIRKLIDGNQEKFGIEKILFQINNIIDPITGRSSSYESEILKNHLEEFKKKQNA